MPIVAKCQCGTKYSFKDEFAGSRAKCPACGHTLVVPAHVTAEVSDTQAPAQGGGKGVLIVVLCLTGVVVLIGGILLVIHFSGPKAPPPSAVTTSAKTESGTPTQTPPAGSVPVVAPPSKVPSTAVQPVAPPSSAMPPMTPAQLLVPFRSARTKIHQFAVSGSEEEAKKRSESFRAAHVADLGGWVDWLSTNTYAVPSTAILRETLSKDAVLGSYVDKTPTRERDTLEYKEDGATKTLSVVWYQFQDVGFAVVEEMQTVVAVRVKAWPGAAAPK
jgi:hypothetical protein